MPHMLEIGTGFINQETKAFCMDLVDKGIFKSFGRMIDGVCIRFENSNEEFYVENMTVDEVKNLLDQNKVSY